MTRSIVFGGLASGLMLLLGQTADEAPKAKKYSNVKWHSISNVDYFPNQRKEAVKIVFEEFLPALEAAGLERPLILEYATGGEWDLTVVFPMTGGPSDLEWEVHPEDVKWLDELAKRQGGADKAEELVAKYVAMIKRYESNIVRQRTD